MEIITANVVVVSVVISRDRIIGHKRTKVIGKASHVIDINIDVAICRKYAVGR